MNNNPENINEAAFEAELYDSLKFYGYLFPENVRDVELFEKLYGKNEVKSPVVGDILSKEDDNLWRASIDSNMSLAAYASEDDQFPEIPGEESDDIENTDKD